MKGSYHSHLHILVFALVLSIFTISIFAVPLVTFAGFGVSPAKIVEDRLIKGSSFERVIYFVQGVPDKDISIKLQVDDSPIKDWITTIPSDIVVIPKGTQQFPVTVQIKVPKDTPTGIYKGFVRASTVSVGEGVEEGTSGVSIVAGAVATLELTVGEGVYYSYAIRDVDIKNIKETDDPTVDINIENKGNVPAGPTEASFELFNKFGDVRLAYVQGVKIAPIDPLKIQNISVSFPVSVGLSPGEYWGLVKLYNDNGSTVREHKDVFNVSKATFWDKFGTYVLINAGILLTLFLILWVKRKRRSRNRVK